ncbi:hypothetical protein GIB67_024770 [Kingdonia uniflora]|uniref:Uncharacterized protein n=1 Tax=Kingdonia uniflora TaxID=39325 RepID=A0A7J7N9R5_9MAGN|nr:hypothetical protein GIB67_024770 [Kingdonia uniflora]
MFPIHRLRDPLPMSASYGAEELWHLTHGMRELALVESARDAQRLQELTDENTSLRRHLDSIDDQLYEHDLHLRRGRDVRVVLLPPGGGVRTNRGTVNLVREPGEPEGIARVHPELDINSIPKLIEVELSKR